jgi:divalent metal cation (Fe/Co/Zn/Cd) transporter
MYTARSAFAMPVPFQTARSYTGLSIAAALVTLGLTFGAFLLTDSPGLLSAAAELLVNLVAALVALEFGG